MENMKVPVLGVAYTPATLEKAVAYVIRQRQSLQGQYLCFSNVHTTVMAAEDDAYLDALNGSARTFSDGAPIAWVLRGRGCARAERVAGPAFMEAMFRATADGSLSHYFYGSTQEVLDGLAKRLARDYPSLKIAGMFSPPFGEQRVSADAADVARIRAAAPDILWVGLGAPKQELWMRAHRGRLACVMAGVGAAFDFSAGMKKRAPLWMQRHGLEWLYRLCQEPARLMKRYLVTNTKFILYLFRDLLSRHRPLRSNSSSYRA